MKLIKLFLVLLISVSGVAQTLNQKDANGKRHGKWKKFYKNTQVPRYEGQFSHGKEIGTFKYYADNKGKPMLKAKKEFNANNNIAIVTFYNNKGSLVSQGKMDGKKYIGKWLYYHLNSKQIMIEENYDKNGLLQGKRLVYFPKGQLAEEATYVNGKREGIVKNYSDNKQLLKESHYKNGQLHGPLKAYIDNGVLHVEGQYRNNKKHGIWKFYKNGKVERTKDFTRKSKNPYKNKKK